MFKKILKITAYILGGFLLLLAIALVYFNAKSLPKYEVALPDFEVENRDSASLAHGAYLVSQSCTTCHQAKDGSLSGALMEKGGFGTWYASNITNHPEKGIGRYTDPELAAMLRTGVNKEGRLTGPFMSRFVLMNDQDLQDVIAFLRSDHPLTNAKDVAQPAPKPSLIGKVVMNLAIRPEPYPTEAIPAVDPRDQVAHGKYLMTAIFECYSCHSATFETNDIYQPELSEGYLAGGNPIPEAPGGSIIVNSANLTMHPEYGIGSWTLEQFSNALRLGQKPNGMGLSPRMPKYTPILDEDIEAIWAYLKTVPIAANEVERYNPGQ